MTSDLLTQKLCDRLRNLCLIEAKLKNCWTKALASKVACSYLRDMYRQQKLTRICLKKIHTDTHTTRKDTHTHTHTHTHTLIFMGFPDSSEGKEWRVRLQRGRPGFDDWVWKIPWRKKWQSTPVFLPGESHGQRSLTGYVHRIARAGHDLVTKPPNCP